MIQTFEKYQAGVARIFASETGEAGEVRGSGFLVSDRYLITCAHVVISALKILSASYAEIPEAPIWLDFPNLTQPIRKYSAEVVIWKPCPEAYINSAYLDDIAVLRLNGTVNQPTIMSLHICESVHDKPFRVWGFPRPDGIESNGSIRARQRTREWLQLQVNPNDHPIYGGFSGAPLALVEGGHFLIVGMVNAIQGNLNSETQTGGQGAYAITSDALSEIWHKQGQLISILEGVNLKRIIRAYDKSRRKDWNSSPQNVLAQLVVDLYEMDSESYQYLKEFVFCMMTQSGAESLQPDLSSYLMNVLDLTEADIESAIEHKKESTQTDSQQVEEASPKLWLMLGNAGTSDQYQLESAFYIPAQQSNAKELVKSISIPQHENIGRADLKNNLVKVLTGIIENLPSINELRIEVFLPFKGLDLAPDCWMVEDEYEEEPVCLGIKFQVVIRVLDRLGYQKEYPYVEKWEKLWKKVNFSTACNQSLVCCSSGRDEIIRCLDNEMASGFRSTQPLKANPNKLPGLLMREGVPIALWVRKNLAECLGEEHFIDILDADLGQLPQLIRAKRNAELADPKHIARNISLLWDDPTNVPPDAPSFSFPT